ncbi:TraM recognition site of TraD and TraG [Micromonospora nigra]|uniref:TraM recognition site of TraD and TraG n=1 Tax=Micromonospora nigra TaxID=145857 RepID=A0A1C6R6Z1_9ACTN|nr:type IV secretory system conjugative DNA transfer family protein [Micromonospora nigra]SCL12778.1 TraM recognition site of TraD and TraG [Micromonospora nigra]SCL12811.1 TraM recognition site of TraD and TraG [Micromonospora nigra]
MTSTQTRFPARSTGIAAICCGSGWLAQSVPTEVLDHSVGYGLIAGGLAIGAGALGRWTANRSGSKATSDRWAERTRRQGGVAGSWDVLRHGSAWAMRRQALVLRPSLGDRSWYQRLRTPVTEYAAPIARVGMVRVFSPVEDVTLSLGGPRTGKTGSMACRILDARGATVVTSTRTDLLFLTGPTRAKVGPLMVFNPSGLGDVATNVKFSPLSGCKTARGASDRASDLIDAATNLGGGGGSGDRAFWTDQARQVLAVLLHAAAVGDHTMRHVLRWISRPDQARDSVLSLLDHAPEMREVAAGFFDTNDRTRSSITTSIRPALAWLTDPTAAATTEGGPDEVFDVAEFLRLRGTLYLLGAEDAVVAPLVAALTAEIARQARRIASLSPSGRLDPPLTLALDEAALICPIPLDRWTADMGGRNITIHIAAQSRAQLQQRWGKEGAAAILNNSATIIIFGGTRDPEDLAGFSTLTGERDEVVETKDADGKVVSTSTRSVPVLSAARIANLPKGYVVLIRRGLAPSIGRVQMAWKRRTVRKVNRTAKLDVQQHSTSYEADARSHDQDEEVRTR